MEGFSERKYIPFCDLIINLLQNIVPRCSGMTNDKKIKFNQMMAENENQDMAQEDVAVDIIGKYLLP